MRQRPSSTVPFGLVVTRHWLAGQGIARHTIDNWVKSGQLEAIARGVLKRPESELTWQAVVYSLQYMGIDLIPGGLTALALQGISHYVSSADRSTVHIYGNQPLPSWVNKLDLSVKFVRHSNLALERSGSLDQNRFMVPWSLHGLSQGINDHIMRIASPELAMFQILLDVPQGLSFEYADQLLQDLPTMSPRRLRAILLECRNVKVKRLFLWLAERNHSPWLTSLDADAFSMESGALGSGKRMIARGGKLEPKYLITVPADMLEGPSG